MCRRHLFLRRLHYFLQNRWRQQNSRLYYASSEVLLIPGNHGYRFVAAIIIMNVGRNFTKMTIATFEPSNEATYGIVF